MSDLERVALAILNSDRVPRGWPPVTSLDEMLPQDAEIYRRNAAAAMREVRLIDAEAARRVLSEKHQWVTAWLTTRAGKVQP